MASEMENRTAFEVQADWCRTMGAPMTERIVEGAAAALDRTTATGRAVLDWPGDPVADAVVLRLIGGLHALHRAGRDPELSAVFAGAETDPGAVAATLRTVLTRRDAVLLPWLAGPPQTNEVGRAAALMTGLLHVARRFGPRFELLEIGSSAGLNLLIGRFGFDLGGVRIEPADAGLTLKPDWRGPPPPAPAAPIEIVLARGVDVAPVDVTDADQADRLRAFVWVEAIERQERLDRAIALATEHGVALDRGDAADWLTARLAEPQERGVTRTLVHSVVWQYLPAATQARIMALMGEAGAKADADRSLAWVSMEPQEGRRGHAVRVRSWPGGAAETIVAATHPHAQWIEGLIP